MQRLVVKAAPSQLAQESTESVPLGEIAEQLPAAARDDIAHLEKRMQIEWSDYVNIDSLLLARMAAENREGYVRFPLPNTGAGHDRALEVIERAIEAMGGIKRLLAIRAMSAMVWIESDSKEIERGGVVLTVIPVTPYLYPVATWHWYYEGWGERAVFKKERYKAEISFDPAVPNPSYVSKNPKRARRIFEALFDCRTALLAKTREKLTPQEEQWFRQANPRVNPPAWVTVYDRYQEVQGVLTPHRWKRSLGRNAISVYLQWAYNGAEPSTAEPVR